MQGGIVDKLTHRIESVARGPILEMNEIPHHLCFVQFLFVEL